jgi:NitT/TauT family transport system substrate-binding protein
VSIMKAKEKRISRRTALALAGVAPVALATVRPAGAQAVTLRTGTSPTDAYAAPLFFAPSGIAAKSGIALDVSLFSSSTATAAGCASGALDIGVADPTAIANGVVHGIPFRVLAACSVYTGTSTSFLCVARSSSITTGKDFNGATLGAVTLGSSIAYVAVRAWLGSNGADLSTIKFVEMPYAAMAAAIDRGTIAGASIAEPFVSQLPPGVKVLANPNEALGGRYATSCWFATASWLQRNASLARRLVTSIYDVARWSNEHTAETAVALATATHLDVDRVRATHRATFATAPETAPIVLSLTAAAKYGVLSRPVGIAEISATP